MNYTTQDFIKLDKAFQDAYAQVFRKKC